MKYIITLAFIFSVFLYAEQDNKIVSSDNGMKQYQKELDRRQMLREAKFLKKRNEESALKLQNWEVKKERLKQEFAKKNRFIDTSFGEGNEYGKQRAKKRKQEYYSSLQKQEQRLIDSYTSVNMKLQELKDEFLFRFAVPLTDAEMDEGVRPKIEDKTKREEMLYAYINENDSWKKCQDKVVEFDKIQNVVNSIEKLFPETKLTQISISQKSEQNQKQMQNHLDQFLDIDKAYRVKYGTSISSETRAKAMLEFIKDAQ